MKLDFVLEKFFDYETELSDDCIYIKKQWFGEPIKVYCQSDEYTVCFATQHLHSRDDEELINTVMESANAEMSEIEFCSDGIDCFGGQIETDSLKNLSYKKIRNYFGYLDFIISRMTFRVYAWDEVYCFEGALN